MKIQTGAGECAPGDTDQLMPPVARRRPRRALMGNWQTALQAVTIFISVTSLTLSSIVFMVLLYTPASSPLAQARDMNDLRQVIDMQRQMIGRLQREDNYQDARQKALQSALAAGGLLTDDVRARLEGIERALMAKEQDEVSAGIADIVAMDEKSEDSSLIGRPDGHEMGSRPLIGRPDGHEMRGDSLIGRPDGHEMRSDSLIGRPDGHESFLQDMKESKSSESDEESYEDILA